MNEAALASLERILQSPLFKKADRQSRFLRYIVEKQLAGETDSLRETSIALEVYERPANYDPKTDPIVRVEASRLRSRLREYYELEGADDPLRIDIPKGSYVPTFERRVFLDVPMQASEEPRPTPEPVSVQPAQVVPASQPDRTRSRAWILAAAFVVTACLVVGAAILIRAPSHIKQIDAIAVLPFADISEKRDLKYVADGLTEELQDELSRIRNLRIVGSTSARQAAANPELRAAARQIGVDALIEGSVRAEDNKVRVSVRLIDGGTGSKIWSGSFEGDRSAIFELEERISQTVADRLSIQLEVRREGIDAQRDPQRAQSHEYFQQARTLAERDSAAPLDEIYRLYLQAATADPSYAPPHAGLASVIIQSGNKLGGPDAKARALSEAREALELDSMLPSAYAALILYYRDSEMNWTQARASCQKSLEKFPNAGSILAICGSVEGILLNFPKQLELVRRAVAIDPLSGRMHGGLMFALYQAGQFDAALSEADAAVRLGSKSNFVQRHRALILAAMGQPERALQVIDEAKAQLGGVAEDWAPVRGYLLGLLKRRPQAEALIRDFRAKGALPHHLGLMYLGLGEREKSLDYYEESCKTDPAVTAHSIPEYYMRTLDGEPRLEAIKRKLAVIR